MSGLIKGLFGGGGSRGGTHLPLETDRLVYAVGDIHGRADLLGKMLELIQSDADLTRGNNPATLVFLGDYIDRGPESAKVLRELASLQALDGVEIVFLKGNHEESLLDFLTDPIAKRAWITYGGLQTVQSFGIRGVQPAGSDSELIDCRDALRDAIGGLDRFLHDSLVPYHLVGNVLFVHAAASRDHEINDQPENVLFWGNEGFMEWGGPDGYWVVHGHTISDKPDEQADIHRIGIDTGAYMTGCLTAIRIDHHGYRFLEARDTDI